MPPQTLLTSNDTACHEDAAGSPERPRRRVLVARFVRHYVEMILAMFAGMALLGLPLGVLYSHDDHPLIAAVEMTVTMSAGMAFWMWYRRHHLRHVVDMTAAMVLPL